MTILDLEDGVAQSDKEAARKALVNSSLDPSQVAVRVNPVGSPDHALDLEALAKTSYDLVILAKSESAVQTAPLHSFRVIALCETPAGVLAATEIACSAPVVALMWGAEDLMASLGGRSSRGKDGSYRDVARFARSQVLLAAGAADIPAIDGVHLDLGDEAGQWREALEAVESGFAATACIHPSQIRAIRRAYMPTDSDIRWAMSVMDAAENSPGVFVFGGQMVDAPVLRHAHRILSRSRRET